MQRYSKNRQGIIECLKSTKTHPTAEWVYAQLKLDYPSLSLATVYRNLAQLKEDGVIKSIGNVLGKEHFDGDVTPHSHAVCVKCGKVVDLYDIPAPIDTAHKISSLSGYDIVGADLKFYVVCHECGRTSEETE